MSWAGKVPKGTAANKPPHGAPCNGCGLCCMTSLCPLASHHFKRGGLEAPCPALERTPAGYTCGLIANPMTYARAIALEHGVEATSAAAAVLNGAGLGCDARLAGEQADPAFYRKAAQWDRERRREIIKAKRIWRIPK